MVELNGIVALNTAKYDGKKTSITRSVSSIPFFTPLSVSDLLYFEDVLHFALI